MAAVDEGSLHRAAARLNLSQSALSRQIQALEYEIGGPLLVRSSTGVSPTLAGKALLEKMAPVLAQYDAALLTVRRQLRGESDQLRIGFLASAFKAYLAPALDQFREQYGSVRVRLFDQMPGEQVEALRKGTIDLALTDHGRKLLGREFYLRKIATTGSIVALPSRHRLAGRSQVQIAELKEDALVVGPEENLPEQRRRLMAICRICGKFRPKLVNNPSDLDNALSLVSNEDGVAVLPAFMSHLSAPGIVFVPIGDPAATWDLFVAWPRRSGSKPLQDFLHILLKGT